MARIYGQSMFVGDVFSTKHYGDVTVIDYHDSRNVVVKFSDGYTKQATAQNILNGQVKNEYQPFVHGVGYIGVGDFSPYIDGHIASQEYSIWQHMLRRCYNKAFQERHPTYVGCSVREDWHNFQNFAGWYVAQRGYSEGWQLDKDMTVLGNKIYSKDACSLLPQDVNSLLVNSKAKRGEFPVGVYLDKRRNDFVARIRKVSGTECLGRYSQPHLAFEAYKIAKESHIKAVANKYRDILSDTIYNNLMNYTVSITD